MDQDYRFKFVIKLAHSLILGVSLVLASVIAARTFYVVKALDSTLQVTGSAKQSVTSDSVKWVSEFSRTVDLYSLRQGYSDMKRDQDTVLKYLYGQGIQEAQVTVSPVFVSQPNKYNYQGPQTYELRQTVEVRSSEIDKVTALAKNLQPLVNQDVAFATQSLEYYYSKLPELRVALLSAAVQDAQARANKIAESTGRRVGSIRSASMGVVQVLSPQSIEISDYGSYDTSSVEKEVMVTVKAAFSLR